jgi:polyphosphate glucokinase
MPHRIRRRTARNQRQRRSEASSPRRTPSAAAAPRPRQILSIDVGGSTVKFLLSGKEVPRKFRSGKYLTPEEMVREVRDATRDWPYDAIAIGLPGRIGESGLVDNPDNLGKGWTGFDFGAAFGVPVRLINDAAMQALGSYEGGRMLFLGLGTGLGSTLVSGRTIVSLELGRLLIKKRTTLGELVGNAALESRGRTWWCRVLSRIIPSLRDAVMADYVLVGGGNARKLRPLPKGVRRGHNDNAFHGGFRLWDVEGVPMHHGSHRPRDNAEQPQLSWRSV